MNVTEKTKKADKIKVYHQEQDSDFATNEAVSAEHSQLLKMFMDEDNFNYELEIENGMIIEGTIVDTTLNYILVDIGYKDVVFVEGNDKEIAAVQKMQKNVGDKIEVMITNFTEEPFQITGSFISLDRKDAYDSIIRNADINVVRAKVIEWTPAGYKLEVYFEDYKIPAFMPNTLAGINKLSDPQSIVNREFEVMAESYSADKGTFIVSRKKYLQSLIPQALENLQIIDKNGDPIPHRGCVTGTTKFGIFVEFDDCLTGMIHKDNLDASIANNIDSIKAGEEINFFVKENIRGKLILTQIWRRTLWDTIGKDDSFEVTVREFKKFGALVQLDEETVGLIHNSEVERSKKTVKVGDKLNVKVISVQRAERKIFLSIA